MINQNKSVQDDDKALAVKIFIFKMLVQERKTA